MAFDLVFLPLELVGTLFGSSWKVYIVKVALLSHLAARSGRRRNLSGTLTCSLVVASFVVSSRFIKGGLRGSRLKVSCFL
jgi:hypothetical protein